MSNQPTLKPGDNIDGDTYLYGCINVGGKTKGILLPPKAVRQYPKPVIYCEKPVAGADSWCDGPANTKAMADAGSKLAQWALDNGMHIPSVDELEIIYRICKPTARQNYPWSRSGINVSAMPPTYPYTAEFPAQTALEQFREGGPEAFEADWYWTSTRHQDNERFAWQQGFHHGNQGYYTIDDEALGCAVRWIDL